MILRCVGMFRGVLGMSFEDFGDVLGMFGRCFGDVFGDVLGMCWSFFKHAVGMISG